MKIWIQVLLLGLFITLAISPGQVFADSPAPLRDFVEESKNGEYVFVMLACEQDTSAFNQLGGVKEDTGIRQKYRHSGLYTKTSSGKPLWTFDWNAYGVVVSDDGHHVARFGPWPRADNYDELAIAFYRDGQVIKTYVVNDLINDAARLDRSVSHYMWAESAWFDETTNKIFINTYDDQKYAFDIATGIAVTGTQSVTGSTVDMHPAKCGSSSPSMLAYPLVGLSAALVTLIGVSRWANQSRKFIKQKAR
jgi:hypothetical protein